MFGGLRAERNKQTINRFRTHKSALLLAYLAYYPNRIYARDELADLLWPDDTLEAARASLRTALNSLRRQLEPPDISAQSVLLADRYNVWLNGDSVITDVSDFINALFEARGAENPESCTRLLSQAVDVYSGELLPGFYENWILSERDRLTQLQLGALNQLVSIHESADRANLALGYAQRAVTLDPTAEMAHVSVMRLLHAAGRSAEAVRHYGGVERIFREQLNIDPPEGCQLLIESLSMSSTAPGSSGLLSAAVPCGDIRDAFDQPSLSAPHTRLNNIPYPVSRFFGRETEIGRIEQLLMEATQTINLRSGVVPRERLLTLVGPGGSGKTRLALEVATRMMVAFNEAVWYVALGDLTEAELIPETVLDSVQSPKRLELDWVALLRERLGAKPALLIFDNYEHLVDKGAEYVADLLEAIPGLVCLVTSRVRLNIYGESVIPVEPLPTPNPSQQERDYRELLAFPSIQLFVDRARCARADFQITSSNAAAISKLCSRLEGIPLAIELAASWAQTMTPSQMLAATHSQLSTLTTARKGGLQRHRSLRATIAWSYDLLTPDQQVLYKQLSVFRAGWNVHAALEICGAVLPRVGTNRATDSAMLSGLTSLVEASLIRAHEVRLGDASEIRFSMLESLRTYAAELVTEDELRELQKRHAYHYLKLAELNAEDVLPEVRDRLDPDIDNLRAALRWCAATPQTGDMALRLAIAMYKQWAYWGHCAEGLEWIERVMRPGIYAKCLEAEAYNVAGKLQYQLRNSVGSLNYQQRHLALRKEMNDSLGIARCLSNIGLTYTQCGQIHAAVAHHRESVELFKMVGSDDYLPDAQLNLAYALLASGDIETARKVCADSFKRFEHLHSRTGMARCYLALRALANAVGDVETARTMYELAVSVCPHGSSRQLLNNEDN